MADNSVATIIDEFKMQMNSYAMLFNYHLLNLCIKAEPVSLLSIAVEIDDAVMNLEEVSSLGLVDEYQFAITPEENSYVFPICKALKMEHPEFEIDQKLEKSQFSDEMDTIIYVKMPEVNEDRYEACIDYIDFRYEAAVTKSDALYAESAVKATKAMQGAELKYIEAANEKLKEIYDWYKDFVDNLKADKLKEVEEGYQKYLSELEAQDAAKAEESASYGKDAMFSMKMNDDE